MGVTYVTVTLKANQTSKKKYVGILVDTSRQTLKRMPAIPLK